MPSRSFRDLIVWQRAIELALSIYATTKVFPKNELFGLTSQLRRAAVAIPSNIAEGEGRITPGEFKQFLGIACGSTAKSKPNSSSPAVFNSRLRNSSTEATIQPSKSTKC